MVWNFTAHSIRISVLCCGLIAEWSGGKKGQMKIVMVNILLLFIHGKGTKCYTLQSILTRTDMLTIVTWKNVFEKQMPEVRRRQSCHSFYFYCFFLSSSASFRLLPRTVHALTHLENGWKRFVLILADILLQWHRFCKNGHQKQFIPIYIR